MHEKLKRCALRRRGKDFLARLARVIGQWCRFRVRSLADDALHRMHAEYRRAAARLILLDCGGAPAPFLGLLKVLARDPKNEVVFISGRGQGSRHLGRSRKNHDFVLVFGDDSTDEELFARLPETAWSVKVGPGASAARYFVESPRQIGEVLRQLASTGAAGPGPSWEEGLAYLKPGGPPACS